MRFRSQFQRNFSLAVLSLAAFAYALSVMGGAAHAREPAQTRILSDQDVRLYQDIFRLQERGNLKEANRLIGKLSDKVLMGHVQLQRYMHPTAYRSSYNELRTWLKKYADHAEAYRIYRLAMRKKPKKASAPDKPWKKKYRPNPHQVKNPLLLKQQDTLPARNRVREINKHSKSLLAKERPTQTLKYIQREDVDKSLTAIETDRIKTWIARQYFLERVPAKALDVAEQVIRRNREALPLADWIAGLSAWQLGKHSTAAKHFSALSKARYASRGTKAAGAYWAARAYLVTQQPQNVSRYLDLAASSPFTFYGVLANRQLGNDQIYDWGNPVLTEGAFDKLKTHGGVVRAAALAQMGRMEDADLELRWVHPYVDASQDRDLLALAIALKLPAAQLQISEYARGNGFETGLYPIPDFEPEGGFQLDRALIYAFIRKESKFKQKAESRVGARGLMQLMPRTASGLAKDSSLRGSNRDKLFDPEFNLKLGQSYLQQLMRRSDPRGNLFALTAAYNGGPGNLRKWINELESNSDPLFFIESIPSGETRGFIEGVLTNLWVYRHRLGQSAPALDAAAAGKWPIYTPVETAQE